MTKRFRTLLLLGFTGLAASLSGCLIETTDSGPSSSCANNQYIQVYWSLDNGPGTADLTCLQAPPSHVEVVTNNGTFVVGKECRYTVYMGQEFDWAGSTDNLPAGTYELSANLVVESTGQRIPVAGNGAAYAIPSCNPLIVAHRFSLF